MTPMPTKVTNQPGLIYSDFNLFGVTKVRVKKAISPKWSMMANHHTANVSGAFTVKWPRVLQRTISDMGKVGDMAAKVETWKADMITWFSDMWDKF